MVVAAAVVMVMVTTIVPIAQIENAARIVTHVVVVVVTVAEMVMTEVVMTAPMQREAATSPT
jgi:hypothetical protein